MTQRIAIVFMIAASLLVAGCDSSEVQEGSPCEPGFSYFYEPQRDSKAAPLCRVLDLVSIKFAAPLSADQSVGILRSYGLEIADTVYQTHFLARTTTEGEAAKHYTSYGHNPSDRLGDRTDVVYATPVFWHSPSRSFALLTDELVVAFDTPLSGPTLDSLSATYGAELVPRQPLLGVHTYLFRVTKQARNDALKTANTLATLPLVSWAAPSFARRVNYYQP